MFQADHGQYREFTDRLFQVKIYLTNGISTEPVTLFAAYIYCPFLDERCVPINHSRFLS